MAFSHHYDFVIIGSGFGGSVSALRLAEKGYRVAVLEAGKRYRTEDFPRSKWWWPFKRSLVSRREDQRKRAPVYIPQANQVTRALAEKTGGFPQSALSEVLLNTGSTAHILGGCPIGPDADHGVIDGQNRVYGHKGIYVVDGSMIPANLGVNPSLTITAMAEHAMSHIRPKAPRDGS